MGSIFRRAHRDLIGRTTIGRTTIGRTTIGRTTGGRTTGVVARAGLAPDAPVLARAGYLLDPKGRRQHLTRED